MIKDTYIRDVKV